MKKNELVVLFEIYRSLNKFWNQEWYKINENGLSVTQTLALDILETEGKQKATDLASTLSITTGGLTGIVDKLVKEGFVKKTRDKRDRRMVYLEITRKGREVVAILKVKSMELMKNFFSPLTDQELQELQQLNKKLHKNTINKE